MTISTPRTLYIMANTQLPAAFAMLTFTGYEYILTKKWSIKAAAEGLIVGLVFVTPACGYLAPWACVVGSIFTAIVCRATYNINNWIGIDDTTHSFNVHGIGGIVGGIVVGVFGSPVIAALKLKVVGSIITGSRWGINWPVFALLSAGPQL
jgi:Amt family ammonium transporter